MSALTDPASHAVRTNTLHLQLIFLQRASGVAG
jgi:hypothetical protein